MRNIFVLLLLIFMLGCSSKDSDIKILNAGVPGQILQDGKWVYPKEPPAGWCIVTDGTQFTWKDADGYVSNYFTFPSKEKAIEGAWSRYKYLNDLSSIPITKHGSWKVVPSPGCSEDK
jgi:accessory colonization factor AcfC